MDPTRPLPVCSMHLNYQVKPDIVVARASSWWRQQDFERVNHPAPDMLAPAQHIWLLTGGTNMLLP